MRQAGWGTLRLPILSRQPMTIDEAQTPVSENIAHSPAIEKPETESPTPTVAETATETNSPDTLQATTPDAMEIAAKEHVAPIVTDSPSSAEAPAEPTVPTEAIAEVVEPTAEVSVPEAPLAPVATSEVLAVEAPAAEVPVAVVEEPAPVETAAPAVAPAPAPAPTAPAGEGVVSANDGDLFEQYMNAFDLGEVENSTEDGSYKRLSKGDRIEATVIHVEQDRVFVDLGTKAEGIIPLSELSEKPLTTAIGVYAVGDKINVVVIKPEGNDGNPIVSRKRAEFEEQWDRMIQSHEDQTPINAVVIDRVKGGLVVDVGVRGFVPATHVGSGKLRNLDKFVGQTLELKVIEIDKERKKVVLSNRIAEEEKRAVVKDEIFGKVKAGDILEGTVRRLTDYGAFVDLGGVDGLLHISEMSWARITHPKEMFKEGQKIQVMVLRLDPVVGKISLGHRQVLPDPWNVIKENYKVGQKLMVTIGRIVTSGAFVKLPENAEAFLPISEMSYRRIKRPQEVIEENQEVEVQILDLRPDERRMVLSMRAIGGGGELRPGGGGDFKEEYRKPRTGPGGPRGGRGRDDFDESSQRRGIVTGGATIGERLGMLKGLLKDADETPEPPASE